MRKNAKVENSDTSLQTGKTEIKSLDLVELSIVNPNYTWIFEISFLTPPELLIQEHKSAFHLTRHVSIWISLVRAVFFRDEMEKKFWNNSLQINMNLSVLPLSSDSLFFSLVVTRHWYQNSLLNQEVLKG